MIRHLPNCPKPSTELATGTKGDPMERCTHCHAWAPISRAPRRPAPVTVEPMPMLGAPKPRPAWQSTPAPASNGRRFTHADDCTDLDDSKLDAVVGRLGDPLLRCPACRKFKVVRPEAPEPATPPPVVSARVVSKHVCRDHHKPVTWRGTGCPACDTERRDRQARRAER